MVRELCYMHVPKTAGISWVYGLVSRLGPFEVVRPHVNCYVYHLTQHPDLVLTVLGHERRVPGYVTLEEHLAATRHDCMAVAFVRNPFDRFVSAFHHLQRGGLGVLDEADARMHLGRCGHDFGRFVRSALDHDVPAVCSQIHFRPQIDWLIDRRRHRLLIDFLGRYETIDSDTRQLATIIGFEPGALPHMNATQHPPSAELYDEETAALVARIYQRDFDAFGYDPRHCHR